MKTLYLTLLIFFFTLLCLGQNKDSLITVDIESGKTSKTYRNGKLESFETEMYAVNYGNIVSFSKKNDTITIENADESEAIIKIYLKNKKQVSELTYKKKRLLYLETIDFDLNKLPSNSLITANLVNNEMVAYVSIRNMESIDSLDSDDLNFDKSFKLFTRMERESNLATIDLIFNSLAEFFSKEDVLLRIYSREYADQFTPLLICYLETNDSGKIKDGIIWTKKEGTNGNYKIYSNEKIIKTENKNLKDYQNNLMEYLMNRE